MAVDLGKMYGPLPLGAWLAVVGGGIGIAVYTRRQNAQEPITDPDLMPEDTGTTPGVGVGGSGQWIDLNPPPAGGGDAPASTNEEWARQTIVKMMALGYPPAQVNSAITKFLVEETLSPQEFAILNEALRKFGSPPVPVKGPFQGNSPPVTTPPPAGGTKRWPVPKRPFFNYTIQAGDTLAVIAAHYGTTALNLYAWNAVALDYRARLTGNKTSSQRGKYIYAGTVLTIPWGLPGQKYVA